MPARIIAPLPPTEPGHDHSRTIPAGDILFTSLAMAELIVHRGNEPPLHRHWHEDLLVYIVDGDLSFHLDTRAVPVPAGSWVLLPRGTEHGYVIQSDYAHLLVILAPAGAEGYLAGLHEPAGPGGSTAIERLIATAARHGIDITGPPPGPA